MIYKNGEEILKFDLFTTEEFSCLNQIAKQPVEHGAFIDQAKQLSPFTVKFTIVKNINGDDQQAILNAMDTLKMYNNSIEIFDVVGLKGVYVNTNLHEFSYNFDKDLTLLKANLTFQQIKIVNIEYSSANFKKKNNTPTKTRGKVQPSAPSRTEKDTVGVAEKISGNYYGKIKQI